MDNIQKENRLLQLEVRHCRVTIVILVVCCIAQAAALCMSFGYLYCCEEQLHQAIEISEEAQEIARDALNRLEQNRTQVQLETLDLDEENDAEGYTLSVVATAYCPCVKCCGVYSAQHPSRQGTDFVQRTSTGTIPQQGRTIAVDPSVIPLGSEVVINGHSYIAEDTGGGIKGNRIDIFFSSHQEALNWGKQTLEVTVFENKAE